MPKQAGPRCKDCVAEGIATRRPAPHVGPRCKTHHLAQKRATREKTHERRVVGTYALRPGDYALQKANQGGTCAVYGCRAAGKTRALTQDHDHVTNEPRGLLCNTHNEWLGRAGDDPAVFISLALYLLEPPSRRVLTFGVDGQETHYVDEFVRLWDEVVALAVQHHG